MKRTTQTTLSALFSSIFLVFFDPRYFFGSSSRKSVHQSKT